ncbi:TPM domain-containing protein [Aeromonas hydrophila]|uniref:TPM domain-containing protein n=1 Tax=Aeromonas hydrophila TaxID=644 RepID=UPI00227A335D|nr:TPM domain-containing protein [Aeromonas hydrophila]WAF92272.1 TPM domain-containing protein [Aeromonas hydrophila]WAG04998.1 TPM domain-containing protein [Aeromonas hydrophila]
MKMMLRWLLPCLLLWASALQAAPDFPTLSGRVVDEASLMSRKQAHQLTQQLAAFEKRSGIQLVVVSIDTLAGDTIEEYGYQLGRHWGIGQKGKDNGVLLLIAQDERKVRIEVGYGLEGALPDAIAANIIQTRILPAFKRGDMVAGVVAGSQAIMQALAGEYKPVENASKDKLGGPWLFILMVIVMIVLHNLRDGGGGGRGGRRRATYLAGGFGAGRSGGGFGGGGGFSGGGGSFGGGGASGGW